MLIQHSTVKKLERSTSTTVLLLDGAASLGPRADDPITFQILTKHLITEKRSVAIDAQTTGTQ